MHAETERIMLKVVKLAFPVIPNLVKQSCFSGNNVIICCRLAVVVSSSFFWAVRSRFHLTLQFSFGLKMKVGISFLNIVIRRQ